MVLYDNTHTLLLTTRMTPIILMFTRRMTNFIPNYNFCRTENFSHTFQCPLALKKSEIPEIAVSR